MKNTYVAFIFHIILFTVACSLENTALLFTLAALAGLIPRRRLHFFHYFGASAVSLALLFIFFRPDEQVSSLLAEVLGLGSVHPFVLIAFTTVLTATLTAIAVNRLTLRPERDNNQYLAS